MKKPRFLASIIATILMLSMLLSSCQKQNDGDVLSLICSSEIISSDTATSDYQKEVSSETKGETSSKAETSSKNSSLTAPTVSSKPQGVSSQPDVFDGVRHQDLIIGKWEGNTDIVPSLVAEGINFQGSAHVKVTYEFKKNGVVLYTIDKDSYISAIKFVLSETLISNLAEKGLSQQDFETQTGMTCEEYIDATAQSMESHATTYTENYMLDLDAEGMSLNIQTGENSYMGYHYEFWSKDILVINEEYGQRVIYKRVK